MKRSTLRFGIFLALSILLAACGQGQTQVKPPEIRYGETECVQCRMIISDSRFAAGYTYEISDGRYKSLPFDDIGDMLIYADKHPEHDIVDYWVHDFFTEEWLDARDAYFMFSHQLETPMAEGTAATDSRAKAEELATSYQGQVLEWEELLPQHRAGDLIVSLVGEAAAGSEALPSHDHGSMHVHQDGALITLGEAVFPIEVASSKLSGSFVAMDNENKVFLMIVAPQEAVVGRQPIEILAVRNESTMEWPSVDDLTLEIVPAMPTMGHGSPNNENPVSIGKGRYRGQVHFTMAGPWTVTVTASRGAMEIGEVVFECDVR